MPLITRKPHQGPQTTYVCTSEDASAVQRWLDAGALTPNSIEWDTLTDAQKLDAEIAVAWHLHDMYSYTVESQ